MLRLSRAVLALPVALLLVTACGDPQDETPTAETSAETGIASETTTASPSAGTPTPIAGLTDTGFTALDGRPLYAECIAQGAPLPPELPTPTGQTSLPTRDPSVDPNTGKTPPAAQDLPSFDLRTATPADSSAWVAQRRDCYGYRFSLPPDWTFSSPFLQSGYQQGENAVLVDPASGARVEVGVFYTPAAIDVSSLPVTVDQNTYVVDGPNLVVHDGRSGREIYLFAREGELPGVQLNYLYQIRDGWYLAIGSYMPPPYPESAASAVRAMLDSLEFD